MKNTFQTPKKVVIPIRYLSELFGQGAAQWLSIKRELDKGESTMRASYSPLVHAINAEFQQAGSGRLVLEVEQVGFGESPASLSIIAKSKRALETFSTKWRDQFSSVEEIPEKASGYRYVDFEGHLLKGGFHAKALDRTGKEVVLYYHASAWRPETLKAHAELLAIIAEQRHGLPRDAVRILDFNENAISTLRWPPTQLRKRLARHCELYELVFGK